uniref:Methyltransferase FkbM domain-containing protein n=1 Tax=Daphnia galeata TaxID=27404 RepID=A0A8J2RR43_9CRUS|nr:unnamed protein product [Daphnia galeata]
MRFTRDDFRFSKRLAFFAFPAGLMSFLYIFSCAVRMDSKSTIEEQLFEAEMQDHPQQLSLELSSSGNNLWSATAELSPMKFNLMEETYGYNWAEAPADIYLPASDCTIEYANANKLQQDHPCVIRLIRRNYLLQPAPISNPYRMDHPEVIDPSDGQSQAILKILQNKTNGFFIECGGYDGEFLSNTLYMERWLGWSGLLIEADKKAFGRLISRNRKAYTSPVCLSTKLYPMQVIYNATVGTLSSILENPYEELKNRKSKSIDGQVNHKDDNENIYKVQCFPLYSILLAVERTRIDYFGLDVEGSEYKILRTIPWHKIDIKTLTVEWNHTPEGEAAITRLMESNKFIKFGLISMPSTREVVYVRDFLDDYRKSKD